MNELGQLFIRSSNVKKLPSIGEICPCHMTKFVFRRVTCLRRFCDNQQRSVYKGSGLALVVPFPLVLSSGSPFMSYVASPDHILQVSSIPISSNSLCHHCNHDITRVAYHRRICAQATVKCSYPDLTSSELGPVVEFECKRNVVDRHFWCIRCHRKISRDTDKIRVSYSLGFAFTLT